MMTDEERVARAICYANFLAAHPGDIERATCQADNGWDMWLAEARAAIEERVARAIIESIRSNRELLCAVQYAADGTVLIDGDVDMLLAARAAIAAIKEASADPGIPVYRLRDGTEDVLGEGP